jgi:hypothetical protein
MLLVARGAWRMTDAARRNLFARDALGNVVLRDFPHRMLRP